jgi:hypothetical protein
VSALGGRVRSILGSLYLVTAVSLVVSRIGARGALRLARRRGRTPDRSAELRRMMRGILVLGAAPRRWPPPCRRSPARIPPRRLCWPRATRRWCWWRSRIRAAAASHCRRRRAVLGNDQVALRGPWAPDNLVKVAPTGGDLAAGLPSITSTCPAPAAGCTYEQWQRRLDATSVPTTYAWVVSEDGQTALQYWFFYIYNDFNSKHEADWR